MLSQEIGYYEENFNVKSILASDALPEQISINEN